jgi:hypothetical protein
LERLPRWLALLVLLVLALPHSASARLKANLQVKRCKKALSAGQLALLAGNY